MKELDLIVSQEKLNQNRKKTLENDRIKNIKKATKENYAEQERLRNACIFITMMSIAIFILAMVVCINANLKKQGYENCLEQGYDVNYCLKHS